MADKRCELEKLPDKPLTPLELMLYEALIDAVEWNWLDEVLPPAETIEKIEAAIRVAQRRLEHS